MANKRVYLAHGLVTNGVAVGGLASVDVEASYRDVIRSTGDGALGTEDVDVAGQNVDVTVETTDVTKILGLNPVDGILTAPVGVTTFSGKESGAITWQGQVIRNITCHAATLNFSKTADARLTLNGRVAFADGASKFQNVVTPTSGQSPGPTQTYPARLYRPNTFVFTPHLAAAINLLHGESLNVGISAVVIDDYSDADLGVTAVDVVDWNALTLTLVHRDASENAGLDRSFGIIDAGFGTLELALLGRGGGDDKTLTLGNVRFTGVSRRKGREYWEFSMRGEASFKMPGPNGTVLAFNGANRVLVFA